MAKKRAILYLAMFCFLTFGKQGWCEYFYLFKSPVSSDIYSGCNYGNFPCASSSGWFHAGIDYKSSDLTVEAANYGRPVKIIENGDCDHGMGNTVILEHWIPGVGVVYTQYAHLESIDGEVYSKYQKYLLNNRDPEQWMRRGDPIGVMGGTGYGGIHWAVHLHYEMKKFPIIGMVAEGDCGGDSQIYFGYTPKHPDNYQYLDPNYNSGYGVLNPYSETDGSRYNEFYDDYNELTSCARVKGWAGVASDPEPTDPDSDSSDLHISRFHIRQVGDDDYEHNVERTLSKGAVIYVEGELKVRNESTQEAEDVDSDYRIENKRDFDDQDTKIDEDNPFDIDPGEKVSKYMAAVKIEVSADGKVATVSHGSMTKRFAIVNNFVKIYFFADVEEPGGDQDISSETDDDEYAKVKITVLDPPTAGFSANLTEGVNPFEVTFIDQSTSNVASWNWNFGDGTTSTLRNPVHTYSSWGSFTVSLTVTNTDGTDTETKTSYIVVSDPVNPGEIQPPSNLRITISE